MKHGLSLRKLSRTSSHRDLMLRNLVTSLFEHEQIQTTLPKAREAARLAEKIITLGKRQNLHSFQKARSFVLKPEVLPKLFNVFIPRYAERPGGYTRIHKYGNREGDNAPSAILELVDNPRDIKTAMTARAVGLELLRENRQTRDMKYILKSGVEGSRALIESERALAPEEKGKLRPLTRWNLQKVLKYKDEAGINSFRKKAEEYADLLLAKTRTGRTASITEGREVAGRSLPGETPGAMRITKGRLGKPKVVPRWLGALKQQNSKPPTLSI